MFKIGEFSKLTQVSVRMLRHYDASDLLNPAKTDPFTGYRLYSADQIPHLNRIVFLRDTGFSVAEIKEALKNWSDEQVSEILLAKKEEIQASIHAQQHRLNKIQLAMKDIIKEEIAIHTSVTVKSVPDFDVISLRRTIPNYFSEGDLWKELSSFIEEHAITATGHGFAIYHDEDFRDSDVDVEICDVISNYSPWQNQLPSLPPGISFRRTNPVEHMASSMVLGPFEHIGPTFYTLAEWLQNHNEYEMSGKSRQIVHRGPQNTDSPDNFLTEIQIELRKKQA